MIHDIVPPNRSNIHPTVYPDGISAETKRVNQAQELIGRSFPTTQGTDSGVANGHSSVWVINQTNVLNNGAIAAFLELTFYINSVSNANILYPQHASSTVDLSNWQILGLCGTLIPSGSSTENDDTVYSQTVSFRNISAGTVDIIARVRTRYIFNRG